MLRYLISTSFRSAFDHAYTQGEVDPNHKVPNSWIYALIRLCAVASSLALSFIAIGESPLRNYVNVQPIDQVSRLPAIFSVIEFFCLSLIFLVFFQLLTGTSFLKLLKNSSRISKWQNPKTKSRFGASSLLCLLLILTVNVIGYAIASTDYINAITRQVRVSPVHWTFEADKPDHSILNSIFPKQTLDKMPGWLLKSVFSKELSSLRFNVTVDRGASRQLAFIEDMRGCLNPKANLFDQWLSIQSLKNPIDSQFAITPSGRAFLIRVQSPDNPASCLKPSHPFKQSYLGSLVYFIAETLKASPPPVI